MRDHKSLVQFSSATDSNYVDVLSRIRPLMSEAGVIVRDRKKGRVLDPEKVSRIKQVFWSRVRMDLELDDLLETLPDVSESHEWLIQRSEFANWRSTSNPSNCLWIEGPPGYGKTVASAVTTKSLAKSIFAETQRATRRKQKTLYSCFFCSEKHGCSTAEDLLKSVLLQMIEQFPNLAICAEHFLDQTSPSRDSKDERGLHHHFKATLTIENLWRCLKDMLEDVSLHAVYIVVNNLHRLAQNESLDKLLQWIRLEFCPTTPLSGSTPSGQYGRWFFTTFSETRDDIQKCLDPNGTGLRVCKMDLRNPQYADQIRDELVVHVRGKTTALKEEKYYDQSLAFEVQKMLESKAVNQLWVDVACLQLGALPLESSRLQIRGRLEAAAGGNLNRLMKESWEWVSTPSLQFVSLLTCGSCRSSSSWMRIPSTKRKTC